MKLKLKHHSVSPTNIFRLAILMLVIGPLQGFAQERQFTEGEYISEGGWGHLFITQEKKGALTFMIASFGANFHTCELEGQIRNGQATLETEENEKPCVVSFAAKGNDIDVTNSGSECRYFCGERAGFEDLYLKPALGCGQVDLQKTRDEFKRLYDKKAYGKARAKLEPALRVCAKTLDWLEKDRIRNDLAITQYKMHDLEGCRRTLQPLAADAAKTNEEILAKYPPGEASSYIEILDAARTNLRLCKGDLRGK